MKEDRPVSRMLAVKTGLVSALVVALVLFAFPLAAQTERQPGLDYWNQINKTEHVTDSGLKYKIQIKGTGKKPGARSSVTAHYRGMLLNGVVFDSSYDSDEPIKFNLRKVIKGWTEGLQLMNEGSVFVFLIPPELAYGEKGSGEIPPNATLIFEVELYDVK